MSDEPNKPFLIFSEAIDKSPSERDAYLTEKCGEDLQLRDEVEKLLWHHDHNDQFMANPAVNLDRQEKTPPLEENEVQEEGNILNNQTGGTPTFQGIFNFQGSIEDTHFTLQSSAQELPQIPGYTVLKEIAQGGMGVVYEAMQVGANRPVALKMIRAQKHDSATLVRFHAEAKIIANLQHPGIVQIFDVGEYEGSLYFSMELMTEGNLSDYLAGMPILPLHAAELVRGLSEAVMVAHRANVIHRDIKPANVLLAKYQDEAPHSDKTMIIEQARPTILSYVAKLTDFGIAKKLDEDSQTGTGQIVGTPAYVSPEQAQAKKDIGPASDIYSLGVLLYECLIGRPPFIGASPIETMLQITQVEPIPPRQILSTIPRDLEIICLKCLRKDPSQRYPSAQDLAEDLQRFLDGKPITAKPVSSLERLLKWMKRRPALASTIAVSTLSLLLLLIGWISFTFRLQKEVKLKTEAQSEAEQKGLETQQALDEAEAFLYARRIRAAHRAWEENDLIHARAVLQRCKPSLRGWEYWYLNHLFNHKGQHHLGEYKGYVTSLCWSRDSKWIASGSRYSARVADQGEIKIWDATRKIESASIHGEELDPQGLCYSPDGRHLAIASWKKVVKIWSIERQGVVQSFGNPEDHLISVCYSPDGQLLAAGGGCGLKVWEVKTQRLLYHHSFNNNYFDHVCFSTNGKYILAKVGGTPTRIKFWNAKSGKEEARTIEASALGNFSISRDDKWIVVRQGSFGIGVWHFDNAKLLVSSVHDTQTSDVQYTPDGKRIVLSTQNVIQLLYPGNLRLDRSLKGHEFDVQDIKLSPKGDYLVSAAGNKMKLWNLHQSQDPMVLQSQLRRPPFVTLPALHIRLSLCKKRNLLVVSRDRFIRVWDLNTRTDVKLLTGFNGLIKDIAIDPEGQYVVGTCDKKTILVWSLETGKIIHQLAGFDGDGGRVCFSPDGKRIVGGGIPLQAQGKNQKRAIVKVWAVSTGKELLRFDAHNGLLQTIQCSPDGQYIATGGQDKLVKVWNATTGKIRYVLSGHQGKIQDICFHPNSKQLVSVCDESSLKIWDLTSGKVVDTLLPRGTDQFYKVSFSANGKRIVTGLRNSVQMWDSKYRAHLLTLKSLNKIPYVNDSVFSEDGQILLSSRQGSVILWDKGEKGNSQK